MRLMSCSEAGEGSRVMLGPHQTSPVKLSDVARSIRPVGDKSAGGVLPHAGSR